MLKIHLQVSTWIIGCLFLLTPKGRCDLVFNDSFNYSNGALAGNNGGGNWNNAWNGSTSSVVGAPMTGTTGNAVTISSDNGGTFRTFQTARTTGGSTNYYISYLFRASPLSSGYGGLSLFQSTTSEKLFTGMPSLNSQLGFENPLRTWAGSASNTTYLMLFELSAGSTGTTNIKMWATTDLTISASALTGSATQAESLNTVANFTFDTVRIQGGTTGTQLAGLAGYTTAAEAVGFTQTAVPEPGTFALAGIGLATLATGRALRRKWQTWKHTKNETGSPTLAD
jgi:hypothetical protein